MDLLDRYLDAIRRNLPPARADDIVEELRGDLLDRVEAREAALGHRLDKGETAALVKAFGHPLVVAGRYREHPYLIGPQAFPFYVYALRVVLVIALTVFLFSSAIPVIVRGGNGMQAALQGLGYAWNILFTAFAIVTVLFAMLERNGFPKAHLDAWRPERLAAAGARKKGKWESPIEVGLGLLLLLLWAGIIPVPLSHVAEGFRIAPAPIWSAYYWPVLILAAARLAYNLIDWLRPEWKAARLLLGGGTIIGAIALVGRLLAEKTLVVATPIAATTQAQSGVAASIDTALHIALLVSLISWGVGLVTLVYRLYPRAFALGR